MSRHEYVGAESFDRIEGAEPVEAVPVVDEQELVGEVDFAQIHNAILRHEHDAGLFRGTEIFFRPGYAANLISSWIPALDGVEEKLKAGAKVADQTVRTCRAIEAGLAGHTFEVGHARRLSVALPTDSSMTFES